jgi:hypothetical protein
MASVTKIFLLFGFMAFGVGCTCEREQGSKRMGPSVTESTQEQPDTTELTESDASVVDAIAENPELDASPEARIESVDQPEPAPANESNARAGNCCEARTTPGCDDPVIEECVCSKDVLPDCCTKAWDVFCVEVVRQHYCEAGIRECVCEQWQQSGCCSKWTDTFCELTARYKCDSLTGCGQ